MKIADVFKKVSEEDASEHQHQVALFIWASDNFENDERLRLLHAIPNGGERNRIVASRMIAEGTRSGVPDVFLPVPAYDDNWGGVRHGLYIEMKRPKERYKRKAPADKWDTGGVSEDQKLWLSRLEQQGYKCVVCYHWHEAASEIYHYLTGRILNVHD